jgi:hypothetical protein
MAAGSPYWRADREGSYRHAEAKEKAVEVMTALNMQVPETPK